MNYSFYQFCKLKTDVFSKEFYYVSEEQFEEDLSDYKDYLSSSFIAIDDDEYNCMYAYLQDKKAKREKKYFIITILDYRSASVTIERLEKYEVPTSWEDYIEQKGFSVNDCHYMISEEKEFKIKSNYLSINI